jgi:Ser/Thr protein kinase RdoA (MazF antagonist)
MLQSILKTYGFNPTLYRIEPFGSGLINHTWKVTGEGKLYILQQINKAVFKTPQDIATNLQLLAAYLDKHEPDYIFAAPLPAADGQLLINADEAYYRLLPFIKGSHTVDFLTESTQAFEAAQQFAKFTYLLRGFDTSKLKYTLPDFHNLSLRVNQFKQSLRNANAARIELAKNEIEQVKRHTDIADIYNHIVEDHLLPLRVIHHDTKINNVLFDDDDKGITVIDLDTVMPGYYISDVGDMMRTYLAEASEEEQDLGQINVRENFFAAIYSGYMGMMGNVLTDQEKELFIYSGKFMIYMQAVRFLTDFLNGDVYYPTKYESHNLMRAKNQLYLLDQYVATEPVFNKIIYNFENN